MQIPAAIAMARRAPAQIAVGAPFLGEFNAGAGELPGILLEFPSEPLEQRDRIGSRASKAGDHRTARQTAQLAGIRLDHRLAHRDLAVAGNHDLAALAQAEDRRAVPPVTAGIIPASLGLRCCPGNSPETTA